MMVPSPVPPPPEPELLPPPPEPELTPEPDPEFTEIPISAFIWETACFNSSSEQLVLVLVPDK